MQHNLSYQDNYLHLDTVNLKELANIYGTPCYIYSKQTIINNFQQYTQGLDGVNSLVCYAVKANSNLSILHTLANQGAGFDVVSGGELARVLKAGVSAEKIVFAGVGKSTQEIKYALHAGIYSFNVESIAEIDRINHIAIEMGKQAPISMRVNPNIDAKTHPYISTGLTGHKFGIPHTEIIDAYKYAHTLSGINIVGVSCHIGSQLSAISPFTQAVEFLKTLLTQLNGCGINLKSIDIGGGLGVQYTTEKIPSIAEYTRAISQALSDFNLKLIIEPGRSIIANAGVLITKVEYLKKSGASNFAIVDAAMNDLMRPCLYGAEHQIVAVKKNTGSNADKYSIVGPVCESSDVFVKNIEIALKQDDILAILGAGAYAFSMSSNYNTRPKVAEVLVDLNKHHLIGKREKIEDLWRLENIVKD